LYTFEVILKYASKLIAEIYSSPKQHHQRER